MEAQLQLFASSPSDADRQETVADIRLGLERMTRLVEQLLDLSRTEPDAVLHPQVPVDVAGLVRSAVTDL